MADAKRRLSRAVTKYADARKERDAAMRAAHKDGLSYRAIAEIVGLSHQRVAQIVTG